MKQVCVVITARPSYSRIRSALYAMKAKDDIELQIVLAASSISNKYGNIERKLEEDGFEISSKVYNLVDGENIITSAKTTGLGIIELSTVFENLKPDYVVTIADRFETIATAIAASYMNIPLVHIQGGEVTGNIDEKVRHAITKLADIHCVATEGARDRLIKMGEEKERIFVTGCPSIDIAESVRSQTEKANATYDPVAHEDGVGKALSDRREYVVVMLHPVTTQIDFARRQTDILLHTVEKLKYQVYWFWPNVDAGSDIVSNTIRSFRENTPADNFYFIKNINPEYFLSLLIGSKCIIGNSSVGIRECSYLGVPAVNIGDRQKGRERGRNVIDVEEFDGDKIMDAIQRAFTLSRECDTIYGNGHAGDNIADVIEHLDKVSISKRLTY